MSDENTNQITPYERTESLLRSRGGELMQLLPGTFADATARKEVAARFMRQVMTACQKNTTLLAAHPESLWLAAANLAAAGLDPSGQTGEAALVPFKGMVTPIIMSRGYVILALRSGAARAIEHNVVCEGDVFDYEFGSSPFLRHKPALSKRGDPIAVWAIATLASGEKLYEVMGWDAVEAIRERSKSKDSGPWVTDTMEMGRKTVLRRIAKRLPWNSTDNMVEKMLDIQAADDATFGLDDERTAIQPSPQPAAGKGMDGLRAKVMPKAPSIPVESSEAEGAPTHAAGQEPQAVVKPAPVASGPVCPGCGKSGGEIDRVLKSCSNCMGSK